MTIAFFCSNITNSGGTERIAIALANELVQAGHHVYIYSVFGDGPTFFSLDSRITVRTILRKEQKLAVNFLPAVYQLRKWLKNDKISTIINVVVTLALISVPASRFLNIKVVAWEHFNFFITLHSRAMHFGRIVSARYADAIVTLTEGDKEAYMRYLRVKGRALCIPNFLPLKVQRTSELTTKYALAVGRLTYQKGYDTLLRIWKQARGAELNDWKLRILGSGEDREMLVSLAEELGIADMVEFIPETKDVERFYLEASVFLVTSRWEGLPMVMIEAKSFGLPIISFDCRTGPRDIIHQNIDGLLIPDQDIDSFARELKALLSNRPRLKEMGRLAAGNAAVYAPANIVKTWLGLLNSLNTG